MQISQKFTQLLHV